MSRTNYSPALAAVYLDDQSLKYLATNLHFDLWNTFIIKIHSIFKNLPIHIHISEKIEASISEKIPKNANVKFHIGPISEEEFLQKIAILLPASKFKDPDWDEVCFLYFKGISPLMDARLVEKSWDRHKKFFSQYSYSENLPEGIIPYILTREFLSTLPDKLPNDVHSFFLKNINQYDVDIFYVPPDLRQYRFDFRVNDRRNSLLIENLVKIKPDITYEEIMPSIQKFPSIYRLAPTYIEWEIYKGCELECIFCPRNFIDTSNEPNSTSFKNIKFILDKLNSEIHTPYTICLGGNGEPLLHPNLDEIIQAILLSENVKELIIETALYKNVDSFTQTIESLDKTLKNKLTVIVNLTTLKSDTYRKLYGKDLHSKILSDIDHLKALLPNTSLHVQMIKMIEVGDEVESFFTHFEKKGINVILQKYNRFAGKLPEKRVSDLTPIHREFCWHLNRDLVIDASGNISICKQNQTESLGNILTEKFSEIWQKGQDYFAYSLLGEHSKIPAPCLNCDEWYTFNA